MEIRSHARKFNKRKHGLVEPNVTPLAVSETSHFLPGWRKCQSKVNKTGFPSYCPTIYSASFNEYLRHMH